MPMRYSVASVILYLASFSRPLSSCAVCAAAFSDSSVPAPAATIAVVKPYFAVSSKNRRRDCERSSSFAAGARSCMWSISLSTRSMSVFLDVIHGITSRFQFVEVFRIDRSVGGAPRAVAERLATQTLGSEKTGGEREQQEMADFAENLMRRATVDDADFADQNIANKGAEGDPEQEKDDAHGCGLPVAGRNEASAQARLAAAMRSGRRGSRRRSPP